MSAFQFGWPSEDTKLGYSLTLMVLQYFFPISVLIFTYTRIAIAVWGKKPPGEAEDARDQRLAKAKRKVYINYTQSYLNCYLNSIN
jgi:neuropeptide Y receptor